MYDNGLYNLRYCFPDRSGMLMNHLEKGVNYGRKMKSYDVLVKTMKPLYLELPDGPFPCYNYHVDEKLKEVGKAFCDYTPSQLKWNKSMAITKSSNVRPRPPASRERRGG